ncbi:hypothetical protein FO519_005367 [Halicephalobus sp. NKZ332]|nr:hypothetical protein FO519_005367 [Halicephalobus sp. NKZ332]
MAADFHPITNLKLVDIRRKENEIQGGFAVDSDMGDFMDSDFQLPSRTPASPFMTIDKATVKLNDLMISLSAQLCLPEGGSESYGLMYEKTNRNSQTSDKSYIFVTEESLQYLKDGFLLIVSASPKNYARKMLYKLENIDLMGKWQQTLETLFSLSQDFTFATEFQKLDGIKKVIQMIQDGVFDANVMALCRVFCVFMELMRHPDFIEWDQLPPGFVVKVAGYVNGSSKFENNESLRLSLSILLTILDKGGKLEEIVKEEVKFESLIRHLEKTEERILLCVLTLMNLLFEKTDEETRASILKSVSDKPFRSAVSNVIKLEQKRPDERIREQLLLVQQIMFFKARNLAYRRPTSMEIERITEMSEWKSNSPLSSKDSFENLSDRRSEHSLKGMAPNSKTKFSDFVSLTPPGSLVLDTILEYAAQYKRRLTEIQLESNLPSDAWPLIMAQLVDALGRILTVYFSNDGEDVPYDINSKPWLLVFYSEKFFLDYFSTAMELFLRTWREMHANSDDEDKVMNVVRYQLAFGIGENVQDFAFLDEYLQKHLSYFHIQKIFEKQRIEREELELKSSTIEDLRNHLRPSMEDLVKTKKKNILKDGFIFAKVTKGKPFTPEKSQMWHWRLDENERFLWYTDCHQTQNPASSVPKPDLKTKKKLALSDIKRIVTGSEYSEIVVQQIGTKLSKKSSSLSLLKQGFSFELKEQAELLTLATDNEQVLQTWIEGLNMLLGNQMITDQKQLELETNRLLDLEVRTRLLNIVNPPSIPPQIPELPKDFNWVPEKYRQIAHINGTILCMEEALEILQYAADPNIVSSESKGITDPIRRIFNSLYQKLIDHGFELSQDMEAIFSKNVEEKTDYRIPYSDLLRIVLGKFITVEKEKKNEEDWTEFSTKVISDFLKVFEILIAVSILPSLETGVSVPMEKRVNFIKTWKPFEEKDLSRNELKKTIEIFFGLIKVNQGLRSQLVSKFLPDVISANEQLIYFSDVSMKERYDVFLQKEIPRSTVFRELLTLNGGFGLSGRKAMSPKWFSVAISSKLSSFLIERNGLFHLFLAFDDLEEVDLRFVPELQSMSKSSKKFASVYILGSVADFLADLETDYDNEILIDMLEIVDTIFRTANKRIEELGEVSEIDKELEDFLEAESKSTGLAVGLVGAILTNATDDPGFKKELSKVGFLMSEFSRKIMEMNDCKIKEIYFSSSENCLQLLQLFKDDLKLLSEDFEKVKESRKDVRKSRKTKFEEWEELLEDEQEAVRGSALIEISRNLRNKNSNTFRSQEDFEWIWIKANEKTLDPDSYVFLASINVLAELSYWKQDPFLQRLVDKFTTWINEENMKDTDIMLCCKLGEVLAKVFRQSGDFSTVYFDLFSNSLLQMTKAKDELMKSSGLSSLADLVVATKGRRYSVILNELLFMISQFLKTEESALVRRSSIHLLRSLISSSDEALLIPLGPPSQMSCPPVIPSKPPDEQYKTVVYPFPTGYETIALSSLIELSPPIEPGCCAVLAPNGYFYFTGNDAVSAVFRGSVCLMRHCNRTLDLLLPATPSGYLNPVILQYIREQFVTANIKATSTHMPVIVDISAFQNFMQFYHMVMENYWYNTHAFQQPAMVPMMDIVQPQPIFLPQQMIPVPFFHQAPVQMAPHDKKPQNPSLGNRSNWNTNAQEFVPKSGSPSKTQPNEVKPLPAPKELPNIQSFDWVQEGAPIKKSEREDPPFTVAVRPKNEVIQKPQPANKMEKKEQKPGTTKAPESEQPQKPKSTAKFEKPASPKTETVKNFEKEERSTVTKVESRNEQPQVKPDERGMKEESVQQPEAPIQNNQPVVRQHRRIYFQSRHVSQPRNLPSKIKVKPVHYPTVNDWPKKEQKTDKMCGLDEHQTAPSSDNDANVKVKESVPKRIEARNDSKKVFETQVSRDARGKVEDVSKKLNIGTALEGVQFPRSAPNSPKEFDISVKTLHKTNSKDKTKLGETSGSVDKTVNIKKLNKEPMQKLAEEMNSVRVQETGDEILEPVQREIVKTPESKSKKKKQDTKARDSINTSPSVRQECSIKCSIPNKLDSIAGEMADVEVVGTKLDSESGEDETCRKI